MQAPCRPGSRPQHPGMPSDAAGPTLLDALVALDRAQAEWLADLRAVLPGDTACTAALVRWEGHLTELKRCIHRAEQRLLGGLMGAVPLPIATSPVEDLAAIRDRWRRWRASFEGWFGGLHLVTTYRRLESCLDLDQEAVSADAVTDLATLAELAETAGAALASLPPIPSHAELEDLAFYRIIAPWRIRGMPALLDMQRWVSETLRERDDW